MEATDGQFKDYIPVTRGLRQDRDWKGVDYSNLGQHWTTDEASSRAFSKHANKYVDADRGGVVIRGMVHKKHVIDPSSAEAEPLQRYEPEKEVSVRKGAPVRVTGATFYKNGKDTEGTHVPMENKRRRSKRGRA